MKQRAATRRAWFVLGLLVVSLTACRRSPKGGAAASAAASASPSESEAELVPRLCNGRAGCAVRSRQALSERGELVELGIPLAVNEEHCDGTEHWLIRDAAELLLARDCDAQGGANARAHAKVRAEAELVLVDYEESRSSDVCAGSSARVSQRDFRVVEERRFGGTGKAGQCLHTAERTVDWSTAKHTARWSSRACAGRTEAPTHYGNAIPVYEVDGTTPKMRLGSCAATVDGAARLRAAVVSSALLIELDGVTRGELTVTVAGASPDDGFMGEVGCGSDAEYRLSSSSIDLESGRVTTRGERPPTLQISALYEAVSYLRAENLGSAKRLAMAWRGPHGERVETARLSAQPTAAELPPLDPWFQSKEPCELRDNRLELRATPSRPLLRLSGW